MGWWMWIWGMWEWISKLWCKWLFAGLYGSWMWSGIWRIWGWWMWLLCWRMWTNVLPKSSKLSYIHRKDLSNLKNCLNMFLFTATSTMCKLWFSISMLSMLCKYSFYSYRNDFTTFSKFNIFLDANL